MFFLNSVSTEIKTNLNNNIHPELLNVFSDRKNGEKLLFCAIFVRIYIFHDIKTKRCDIYRDRCNWSLPLRHYNYYILNSKYICICIYIRPALCAFFSVSNLKLKACRTSELEGQQHVLLIERVVSSILKNAQGLLNWKTNQLFSMCQNFCVFVGNNRILLYFMHWIFCEKKCFLLMSETCKNNPQ